MANLSAGGLSNFRRWYTQYKATHGTEPPSDLMDRYLSGEMEAEEARSQQSRQISLQEKGLDLTADYQNRSLAQRASEFATQTKLQKDAQKSADQAAMVSGVKDLASLGIEGYKTFGGNKTTQKTTSLSAGETPSSTGTVSGIGGYTTPSANPYSEGMVTSGLGSSTVSKGGVGYSLGGGADTGLDLSRYSLTEGGGTGFDASKYSMGGETAGAGTNWGSAAKGLGTVAASAAIEASRPAVTSYLGEKNVEAGKAADISSQIGQGALWGSRFGGVGSAIGAVIGAEKGGSEMKGIDFKTTSGWKEYNKTGGVAALFGITSGQVESDKDSGSVKTAKAVLTGGMSKIAKKLKKLF